LSEEVSPIAGPVQEVKLLAKRRRIKFFITSKHGRACGRKRDENHETYQNEN